MSNHSEVCWQGCPNNCPNNCPKSEKSCRKIPSHLLSLLLIFYSLLKKTKGSNVLDPDPELINAQNLDFAKPKLFFKNIGHYAATSTYIHIRIPFNFITVFYTKTLIAEVYNKFLDQHEEPFKSITKSVTEVSLATIENSLEDFRDIIKALPQKSEISMPGRPKRFIAIGISITAMAMSTFNTIRITQLDAKIHTLKEKTDLILYVVHLHEWHLHHLEAKLEQTNKILADLLESNIWFSSKVTNIIKKKFQSVVHHHENVVKSAQQHRLAPGALPHDILDGIISHMVQVATKKNLVPFVKFASDLFQIEVSHLYMPATNKFTLILHVPMVSNANLLNLYEFWPLPIHFNFAANILIMPGVGLTNLLAIGHSQSFQTISSSNLHACLHLGDTFFCKGRKVMETSLKRSCLGAFYMANYHSIQNNCWFKIAEACKKIFELLENTLAVYLVGTISTNKVCPTSNNVTEMQIQSGDIIKIKPGCYVHTRDHVISADESETIKVKNKAMDGADGLVSPREQGSNPPCSTRTQDQVQQQIWCHHSPGPIGPPANPGPPLGFHFSSCHDLSNHLHLRHRYLPLETLLPIQRDSDTDTFPTTQRDASHQSPTSSRSQTCTCTCSKASCQQLSCMK